MTQAATVTSLDDLLDDEVLHFVTIEHTSVSNSTLCSNSDIHTVTAVVLIKEELAVMISTSAWFVVEGGFDDIYGVVLNSKPWADVAVRVQTNNECYRNCSSGFPSPEVCATKWMLCNVTATPEDSIFPVLSTSWFRRMSNTNA